MSGDVLTSPFTFPATVHAIKLAGLNPVFVDIDSRTLNIDPVLLQASITANTSAIMPIHTFGIPCDVDLIDSIANNSNLSLIYDSAHAFAVKCHCGSLLNHGNFSVVSFHATKIFNTFEGGVVVCQSLEDKHKLDLLKNFGIRGNEIINGFGINAKMNEFQAALGCLQLNYVDYYISKRKRIADAYLTYFSTIDSVVPLLKNNSSIYHNYSYFPVLVEEVSNNISRDKFVSYLHSHNIYARKYFYPLVNQIDEYNGDKSNIMPLPVATRIAERIVCLPIYPDLSDDDLDHILRVFDYFFIVGIDQ